MNKSFEMWTAEYKKAAVEGGGLLWPSETLVRLLRGTYIPNMDRNYRGQRVIEVGFGNCNNMLFLATLGLSLAGTEVHEDICELARQKLAQYGYTADLRVGTNRHLPFDENEFDLLVSWNVIHYEDSEAAMREAIAEYGRVLKPGGRFVLSTTGPEHMILQNSQTLGCHRYRIGRADDFRQGQVYFYFDAPNYIQFYFGEKFRDVLVGRTHDFLMTDIQDYWIVTGVK